MSRSEFLPSFAFDNSYARDLVGLYAPWQAAQVPAPRWLKFNAALATELGLDPQALQSEQGAAIFSGNQTPEGAAPLAQAYAGHQFGGFSPQLGDGRALLLGELIDTRGQRRDIALKGSGRTPFSRGGDGKAAIGPVLREYLMGEAMHALGIPTTRALAAVATGEQVHRDSGPSAQALGGALPGAVLTRVASSHLRVGTFQFVAARGSDDQLRQLLSYAVQRHDPTLLALPEPERALAFLHAVAARQAALVARWMGVGFIHGVMNTDNMSISGETIDYGPCAFMNTYDPATVFSAIDTQGRYAYGNQPAIARWNVARLAEALLPLLSTDADKAVALATEVIDAFPACYEEQWTAELRRKLGLHTEQADDTALAHDWLNTLQASSVDFTQAFRALSEAAGRDSEHRDPAVLALFAQSAGDHDSPANTSAVSAWLLRWRQRLAAEPMAAAQRSQAMRRANPVYIPRNHMVEAALAAAVERNDLAPFDALLAVLQQPFEARTGWERYALPPGPEDGVGYRTFCGT